MQQGYSSPQLARTEVNATLLALVPRLFTTPANSRLVSLSLTQSDQGGPNGRKDGGWDGSVSFLAPFRIRYTYWVVR